MRIACLLDDMFEDPEFQRPAEEFRKAGHEVTVIGLEVEFTRRFVESGKPSLVICHGPQLLITAEVVRGRRLTAWQTIQGDLSKVGADVVDEGVVVDRDLVTSRKPADIPAFVSESLGLLRARGRAA